MFTTLFEHHQQNTTVLSNYSFFHRFHKVVVKKLEMYSARSAMRRIIADTPKNTFDTWFFPWNSEKKTYDISKFKVMVANSTLTKEVLEEVRLLIL